MSPYELWETKCSESNFISTHHWHATFRACKTIFHEKLDLRKMHTMMHIQTFWKITGASFKLHDSEYIISWPLHDLSFTLNEKTALKIAKAEKEAGNGGSHMGELVSFLQDAKADYKIGALLEWWSHSLTASDPLQNRADLWIRYENLHVCTWKLINKQCTNISINMGEIVQFLQESHF